MIKKNKIRILYLIETGGPGGAERMLTELASNVNREIFCPIVCLTKKGWLYNRMQERGVSNVLIRTTRRFDLGWIIKISNLIKMRKIGLIHTHLMDSNFYGSLASLISRCPQIATEHGDIHHLKKRSMSLMKYFIVGLVAKRVVAVSNFTARKLRKILSNDKKISIIYNGIDIFMFDQESNPEKRLFVRKALDIPVNAIVVICVANLYPAKGYDILLKAISLIYDKLPNLYTIAVGRGELEDEIIRKAEVMRIKDRFHVLGFRDDVPELLNMSDIFVLPSLSEAMPISLLEAMASGLPVIASDVGGVSEILEDGKSGFLISKGDFKGLAEKILILARHQEKRKDMGFYAKKRVQERFDIKEMVRKYEKLYLEYAKTQ